MICLRIAAATTALLALAGVAVHSLTKTSSAGTDFYTMKREVMETEYCTANPKTCLAIFYDLESRLYTGEGVIASDRRRLSECSLANLIGELDSGRISDRPVDSPCAETTVDIIQNQSGRFQSSVNQVRGLVVNDGNDGQYWTYCVTGETRLSPIFDDAREIATA